MGSYKKIGQSTNTGPLWMRPDTYKPIARLPGDNGRLLVLVNGALKLTSSLGTGNEPVVSSKEELQKLIKEVCGK